MLRIEVKSSTVLVMISTGSISLEDRRSRHEVTGDARNAGVPTLSALFLGAASLASQGPQFPLRHSKQRVDEVHPAQRESDSEQKCSLWRDGGDSGDGDLPLLGGDGEHSLAGEGPGLLLQKKERERKLRKEKAHVAMRRTAQNSGFP